MKGKKIHKNSSEKLFAFVVFTIASILGLIYAMNPNVFSSLVVNKNSKAAGTVPDHTKGLTANGDGTYKLSLDVKGEAEKQPQKANVIVVFDTSSSMNERTPNTVTTYTPTSSEGGWSYQGGLYGLVNGQYVELTRTFDWGNYTYHFWYNGVEYTGQRYTKQDGNQSRLEAAKSATNSLAAALLAHNGVDGNDEDTIEIALVDFANTAEIAQAPTTDYDTFAAKVNSRDAGNNNRGTNWEAGFRTAINVDFEDDDPTYVIFVSDGNPTFYLQDPQNTQRGGTGQENNGNINTSYNQAVPAAEAIVNAGYNLYTIGIYGNVDRMEDITTDAGAPAENYYSASDTAALQNAFNDILTKIEMSGIANATINDGTTHNVKTTSGQIANLLEVDEDSFKYYKDDVEWADAPEATFNKTTGEVEWDLSSLGVLENGVTYKVTFDVYPSQYTYDIVSEMKNGDLNWLSLDENVRKYLNADGTLNTNTSATLHYKDTRVGDQPKTADYTNPDPVATETFKIGAHKEWVNLLDNKIQNDKDLILTVTRDGEEFHEVTLNEANNYTINTTGKNGIHIAPGLMKIITDKNNNKSVKLLDTGHDYTFAELDGDYYNWNIKANTVRPMIINGQLHNLILVDENLLAEHPEYAVPTGMGSNTYYQENTNAPEFVKINGKTYVIQSGDSITVDATNNRRSNLNIVKKVDGASAPEDAEFDFSITVTDDGIEKTDKIYLTVFDTNDCDAEGMCKVVDLDDVDGWEKEPGTTWSGYYMAPSGTVFNATLKNGYNVLVTNLTDKASYVINESNLPTHFSFDANKTTVSAENNKGDITLPKNAYTVGNQQVTGSIDRNNASYTVQVTNVYDLVDVSVKKVWDDNRNQDGKRGNGAVFNLYANGDKVNGKTQTIAEDGTVTFAGLDRFDENGEIVYTVVEDAIPGYTTTPADATDATKGVSDGATVTNKHVPEVIDVSVTKEWDDNNNQDGIRGKVTFKLNGESPIELDGTADDLKEGESGETAAWVATWKNLPKYRNGQAIDYHVTEDSKPNGYTVSYGENGETFAENGGTIKNTHTPETTEVSVTKIWDDGDNRDDKRPDKITFKLSNNATIELDGTADNLKDDESGETAPWVATFRNLPKYENGNVISYTVVEASVPTGYTVSYGENGETSAVNGGTITNTYKPEVTSAMVKKVWDDKDNQDGKRPTSIKVTLSDGKQYSKEVILNAGNQWTASVTGLPKNDKGQAITYTWTEDENGLNGYELTNTVPSDIKDNEGVVIGKLTTFTNSYTPETTEVSVTKSWDDNNNQDGKRGKVVFKLSNNTTIELDGTADDLKEGESGETAPWVATWKNLPKYNKGQEIDYTVVETSTPVGYTVSYGENGETFAVNGGTIKNTHAALTTKVTVTKEWKDNNDQDRKRSSVNAVVQLYKTVNGKTTAVDDKTARVPSKDGQVAVFDELPVYEDGNLITYSIKETMAQDSEYTPEIDKTAVQAVESQDGTMSDSGTIKVTNKYTPEITEVSVTKSWDDKDNQDGIRPGKVVFKLSNNATIELDGTADNLKDDESGETAPWVATFKNLPKYNDGELIKYTVVETSSATGYTVSYGDEEATYAVSGGIITNIHTPAKTKITVTKEWRDENNQDGYRSKVNAKVQLWKMVDGKAAKVEGEKAVPVADGNVYVYENLPVFEKGNPITYYVEETMDKVEGKDVYNVTGDDTELVAKEGDSGKIALVNTHTPDTINIEKGYKVWKDANNQDGMRPDYIIVNVNSDAPNAQNPVKTVRVDGKLEGDTLNRWSYSVKELPRYRDQGQEIHYSVTESYPDNFEYAKEYAFSIDKDDKYTIINTHNTKTTEVEVTKKWEDTEDQDGMRPEKITLTLYANGDEVPEYKNVEVLPKDGNKMNNTWSYTFTGLDMYSEGEVIVYTVAETPATEGYNVNTVYSNNNYNAVITNTHTPSKLTIKGTKVWDDNTDKDVMRPDYINIRLTKNGKATDNVQKVTAEENWSFTFSNLDEFENHGEKIVYGVQEEYPEDYEFADLYQVDISDVTKEEVNQKETDDTEEPSESEEPTVKENNYIITVTNKYVPEYVSITMNKIWEDENNNDGIRPQYITVNLLADGEVIKSEKVTEADGWKVAFTDLPKYKNHKEVIYTITEDVVEKYKSIIIVNNDNTEFTITNQHDPEKTKISGTKTWQDDEKNLDKRPSTITIKLYADGEYLQTITVSNQTNWQYLIENLYKYKNGKEITYTIVEDEVEDYTSVVNGFDITNIYTGGTGEVVPPNTGIELETNTNYEINYLYMFLATIALGSLKRRFNN